MPQDSLPRGTGTTVSPNETQRLREIRERLRLLEKELKKVERRRRLPGEMA